MISVCINTGVPCACKQSAVQYLRGFKDFSCCLDKMKLCLLFMFLNLFVLINGMPPISKDYNTHCRCLQVESRIIPPDSLRSIKLIPEGSHCPDIEVIAGLASGERVCLNPRSSWVKRLIQFVLERQLHQQGRALPKNQAHG